METPQPIEFRQVRSFDQKINATFSFIRQNFKPMIKTIAIIAGPVAILTAIISTYIQTTFVQELKTSVQQDIWAFYGTMIPFYLVSFLLYYVSYVFIIGSTYEYIALYIERRGNNFSAQEVWERFKKEIFQLILLVMLQVVICIVGTLLFIIPGIYAAIALSLSSAVLFFERKNSWVSVTRSFSLIAGNWWRTLGLMLVTTIILYLLLMLVSIPQFIIGVAYMAVSMSKELEMPVWLEIVNAVMGSIAYLASLLGSIIILIAMAFHYFSLVEEKERRGLMEKISSIGTASGRDTSLETY